MDRPASAGFDQAIAIAVQAGSRSTVDIGAGAGIVTRRRAEAILKGEERGFSG